MEINSCKHNYRICRECQEEWRKDRSRIAELEADEECGIITHAHQPCPGCDAISRLSAKRRNRLRKAEQQLAATRLALTAVDLEQITSQLAICLGHTAINDAAKDWIESEVEAVAKPLREKLREILALLKENK